LLDDVGNRNVLHGHDLILSVSVFDVIYMCLCTFTCACRPKSCWARVSCSTCCLV